MSDIIFDSIASAKIALSENLNSHWIIGFSGGKDSTATLKVFLAAYQKLQNRPEKVTVIYCDTGVENPVIDAYVRRLFDRMQVEFELKDIAINLRFLKAPVEERFLFELLVVVTLLQLIASDGALKV
jgi:DNA sulfur modification protein DndC